MGRYINIRMQVEGTDMPISSLFPLFTNTFFKPVALGGIDVHEEGDNWFLAGYAMESFISPFLERGIQKPASIELSAQPGSEEHQYLLAIADTLTGSRVLPSNISPFEMEDTNVTFLPSVELGVSVLEKFSQWKQKFPTGAMYLYGTVDVVTSSLLELPWDRTFRFKSFLDSRSGTLFTPFLFVRVGKLPFSPDATEILIYSESTIWLHNDTSLAQLIGKKEGDVNLARLVSLTKLIMSAQVSPILSKELNIDGGVFQREQGRIVQAFSDVLFT